MTKRGCAFDQKHNADIDASILTDHMMMEATELGTWQCMDLLLKPDYKGGISSPDYSPVNILAVDTAIRKDADLEKTQPAVEPVGRTGLRSDVKK